MRYISTRGAAPSLDFEETMLAGLARDGGLYVPESWPALSREEISALAGLSYPQAAWRVMRPFIGDAVPQEELSEIVERAYGRFTHRAVAPLVQIGPGEWVLELFHGPTLAFKDIAMQVLALLMDRTLKRRGARATIIGATSGDTGGAAIEAFRGREAIDIFILHPHGRVSDAQRRQMTTAVESNVHNVAVQGTFDDCQALLKALFNDHERRDRLSLAGVNSINWARIMAQIVYYFTAAVALGAPDKSVRFSVPTGNFGDIFAGYVAKQMGLPIKRLVIATNINDILSRMLASGRYAPKGVIATSSPSMDIQVSSNFERLLFEATGRDGDRVGGMLKDLARNGTIALGNQEIHHIKGLFTAERVDEAATAETIRSLHADNGYLVDPHTAVGVAAAWRQPENDTSPLIALATAHPAKFADAVMKASGRAPEIPERLAGQLQAEERYTVLPNDYAQIAAFIETRSRAAAEAEL